MSQLVPKYSQALFKAGMRTPYGKAARAASFAYQNREAIGNAAKYGIRATNWARQRKSRSKYVANKRAAFSSQNVGDPVGSSATKKAVTDEAFVTPLNTRTLYSHLLTDIQQGTNEGQRLRRIVNLRGLKTCLEAINLDTEAMYFNWAILAPKNGASNVTNDDFFRIQGSNRATDFSIALEGYQFACYPINTDRYTVLKHERLMLVAGTQSGQTNDLSGSNHTLIDHYQSINRQIRFDSSNTPETGFIYFVFWFDRVGAASASLVQTGKVSIGRRHIAYFHEPTHCC